MAILEDINHNAGGALSTYWDRSVSDSNGRFSVTAPSGLNGTANGLNLDQDVSQSQFGFLRAIATYPSTNELRLRFRFKASAAVIPSNGVTVLAVGLQGTAGAADVASISISNDGVGGLEARGVADEDPLTQVASGKFAISKTEEVCLEIALVREASSSSQDGELRFYINGVEKFESLVVENFTLFSTIDTIKCVAQKFTSITGDLYIDEVVMSDDPDADLGCSGPFSGYDLILGGGQP